MNASSGPRTQEDLERARQILQCLPNVIGVGLGLKETRGGLTGTTAWRVYVRTKLPTRALAGGACVPPSFAGLATDVLPAPIAVPSSGPLDDDLPLGPGATISNLRSTGRDGQPSSGLGTLGLFALTNGIRRREVVLVSNRHVLLAHGAGRGDPVYHPLLLRQADGWRIHGDTSDPVAQIHDEGAEVNHPFRYPGGAAEGRYFVDCATACLLRQPSSARPSAASGIARVHALDVIGGRAPVVRKLGCATGGERRLETIVVRGSEAGFTGPGDSGGILLNARGQTVGLVWGRSLHDSSIAYASHIHPVLDRLNVTPANGVQ
jgi:hypothetical protein